ncbi:hypothetical protein BD414DRAFT_372769, partial [Trametes punicea]
DKSQYSVENVPDLHGKTALVTGATSGVGLEVAKIFASKRARVLILARPEDGPNDAIEQIRAYSFSILGHNPDLKFFECDLADVEDVKRVGDEMCESESRLDILVCDAGVGLQSFDVTADGVDHHFAVTHLGHFLLINRLLPLLRHTATIAPQSRDSAPRIVCVTSTLHAAASPSVNFMSYAELTAESYAASSPLALYARAKLATVLFVKFGLAPRLRSHQPPQPPQPRGILALAADAGPVHPGQPDQLADAYGPVLGTAAKLATAPLERTPADAARSTLWAATAREVEDDWIRWQGAYVAAPGRGRGESAMARDAELGERLWEMSKGLIRQRLGDEALRPWT